MRSIIQWPSWVYQRYREAWEHAVLAACWASLYVLCDTGIASAGAETFPVQWRVVLAASILVGGMWKPAIAYALFIAAMAYPLYQVSVYLMALALAVLILSAPATVRFLPQTLAVLIAPLLAPVHLAVLLPLLAGLWWGEVGGAVVGGLSALWLKVWAGMAGAPLDLWQINGWIDGSWIRLSAGSLYERFHPANSLQTLLLLIAPFGSDSLVLLFNLLQVIAWAAAGFVVGFLMRWQRAGRQGWAAALSLGPGLVLIWAGYVAVPTWLPVMGGASWLEPVWLPAQVLLAGALAWCVYGLGQHLRRPVVASRGGRSNDEFKVRLARALLGNRPRTRDTRMAASHVRHEVTSDGSQIHQGDPVAVLRKRKPARRAQDDEDIIMLELD